MWNLRRSGARLSFAAVMCMLLMVLSPFPAEALAKRNIANATVISMNVIYNGQKQKYDLAQMIRWGNKTLEKGKDYKVVSGTTAAVNAGTYTCKIQGIGKYTGTRTITWKIKPRNLWGSEDYITLTNFKYNGRSHTTTFDKKPAILKKEDYSLSGKLTATKKGRYQVTIKGKRNWCGSRYLYWNIS
jgi:hypothetical protein